MSRGVAWTPRLPGVRLRRSLWQLPARQVSDSLPFHALARPRPRQICNDEAGEEAHEPEPDPLFYESSEHGTLISHSPSGVQPALAGLSSFTGGMVVLAAAGLVQEPARHGLHRGVVALTEEDRMPERISASGDRVDVVPMQRARAGRRQEFRCRAEGEGEG